MKHRSFQIDLTRKFSPLDDDEYQQLHLVYLFGPGFRVAASEREFFWAGDDLDAFFQDVEESVAFRTAVTKAVTPVGIYVGQSGA